MSTHDDDAPGPPISVPDSGDTGEGGKLKMIVQLVKKSLGVKDIAAMRLSLPASLLEPIPNLEYWHYLDRPDFFAAINDHDDPFLRMLSVLRFTFTKDLKFVHGKVCKPYNSVLGEHFRAHWDIVPATFNPDASDDADQDDDQPSENASMKSGSGRSSRSGVSSTSASASASKHKSTSTAATSPNQTGQGDDLTAQISNLHLDASGTQGQGGVKTETEDGNGTVRVVYLTEQISHHPPVSAYYAACPSRHIEMNGIDQIAAKVSGTTLRVAPGEYNRGIYIHLTGGYGEGERYHVTHPVASVNGILRGSFYVTIGDSTVISCEGGRPGHKFRTIIEYKEESWLGRAHYLLEGVIHTVFDSDEDGCAEWTKVKHVPQNRVVAVFDGTWRGLIRWKRVGTGSYPTERHDGVTRSTSSSPNPSHARLSTTSIGIASKSKSDVRSFSGWGSGGAGVGGEEYSTLVDLSVLDVVPKVVRKLDRQGPRESRSLWKPVTSHLLRKEYSEATREKVTIEQRQRDDAAERKRKGVE
ncbi:hypothetical protein CVT24_007586 [Panaeolus cyanescens]|uniref:Oxysterol-binding protein n=1 Tax=Panaeolus cyanescens TaxID=181874 RepID=A0A409YKI3_9AGAR|nr:hypothetical protein CVT24_007586 [Panaeolus cyanescens]